KFYLMADAGEVAAIDSAVLRGMQISTRKTEYIKGVLASVESGELSKSYLETFEDYDDVFRHLTSFRGIGPWSANTVLMRTLKFRNAVPIGDAGIKNAIKLVDGMEAAPTKKYVNELTDERGRFGMYGPVYMRSALGGYPPVYRPNENRSQADMTMSFPPLFNIIIFSAPGRFASESDNQTDNDDDDESDHERNSELLG